MRSEAVLRDFGALGKPRRNHPPPDRTLQRAKPENEPQTRPQRGRHPTAPQEPDKRQEKSRADQPAEQTMRPFPPIDGLELTQAHAGIKRAVLRNGLIFRERVLPVARGKRRQRAHDRLPLGDREAGFRQPRRAADQNHRQHQRGDRIKPQPDRARVRVGRRIAGHHRSACRWRADHIVLRPKLATSSSLRVKRSNPVQPQNLDCFVATLLAMTN